MLLRGEYGRLPGHVNEEVRNKAIGSEDVLECRPADRITPEMEAMRKATGEYIHSEEDLLSYIMFPHVAEEFLKKKYAHEKETTGKVREIVVEWEGAYKWNC